ncbi:MAG TPA: sialidase family protein, partial [Kofleriaceae bacterium]
QAAARDVGFGPSELLPITGGLHDGPAALLDDQGAIVARADARLARDRKGTLYAVSADGKQIQLATSTDRGATWSAPIAVSDPADCEERAGDCVERPLIVASVDAKTKADVLYVIYAAGDHGARVRSSRDGGKTWAQGPIALAGSYGSAVASGGKLHLAMLAGSALGAYGSAQQVIEYTASSDGGATFREPVTVSARDEMLPYWFANPSLAVDDRRKWLYVAYARGGRDAAWEIAIAASKDNGVTWKRTKLAGNGCAIHMVPNLALDAATGTLHVAYYDSEGAPGRFVHATCGPGATKCKLVGSINSTPFATLSLARHTSKSVGDYASLVVDDKRRLLHAVWAQPVDETGKAIARVFHGTAKLAKR